ncbi:unnamed protein product [Rangifer tarandus platyrhynchus]|uniref:Uncharacterized protein n=2 Tax=Rangifer tarandus platyrhynchus TaxID=3082113 RepID=A0ABN8YGE2_RANTA|nr:unnamed protein product [Rangifer tarandus platyrhynchus]
MGNLTPVSQPASPLTCYLPNRPSELLDPVYVFFLFLRNPHLLRPLHLTIQNKVNFCPGDAPAMVAKVTGKLEPSSFFHPCQCLDPSRQTLCCILPFESYFTFR